MSAEEEKKVEEIPFYPKWKDFREEKPDKTSIIIVLTKYGMHFYYFSLNSADDPINSMCGLFYVRSDENNSGLRYSIETSDILYWMPIPEVFWE